MKLKYLKRLDYPLFFLIIIFLAIGILFLVPLSAQVSLKKFGNTNYFLFHQLICGFLPGIILGMLFFVVPLSLVRKTAPILLLLNIIALLLIFLPRIGFNLLGASRWLSIGKISFQPSEFLKVAVILYLGSWLKNRMEYNPKKGWLSKKQRAYYNFKQVFIPFLFFWAIISLIFIFQPDISTLGIITLICFVIYLAAGAPLWHSVLMVLIGAGGFYGLINLAHYRFTRLIVFLEPETDPLGIGFQMKQSLIGIGSGGVLGKGLGLSSQKFGFLPHPMSDSVFAVFAEETGFIGSLVLIFLFLAFLWRGLKIARGADDKFCQLVALGITFWLVIQGFLNIGAMIGLLPLGGIPLPFISYGGSHLVAELIGVGILLNISKNS